MEIFFGLKSRADDVQSETSLEIWLADDICHPECYPERHPQASTSSRMSSTGMYVIRMSSAELLMVNVDLNYLSTVIGTGY